VPAKPLASAASDGDIVQLKLHIAKHADLDKPDDRGTPPLCYAAEGAGIEAVKLLLDAGAKASATGAYGRTALMAAAQGGKKDVVDALIATGADVKAKDNSQLTALHMAASMGRVEIVEALIKAGADVNAEDKTKQTPLMLAMSRQQTDVADVLKKNGAKEPSLMRGPYGQEEALMQAQAAVTAPTTNVEVKMDPNAVREQVKGFDGLAVAIKAVEDKSDAEEKSWVQRRIDNRAALLGAAGKQFADELTFMKQVGTEEKAAKTSAAIDQLVAKRKQRNQAVAEALREARRATMDQSKDTMGAERGRGVNRGNRGRGAETGAQGANGPYGNSGNRMTKAPVRAEPNRPPVDGDTQAQAQAWVSAKPESKDSLLTAVHKLDLAELEALRTVAGEEEAKKTAATISGIMLARQERVDRIVKQWKVDDERQAKLQERTGTQPGMTPGTGQRGTVRGRSGQQEGQQPGTTGGRRYR
jgi:hypothetical protein